MHCNVTPPRLLSCHLVHLDAAHLLTNLSALLPDCASLETAEGSALFAADLLLLGLCASCAYVGSALLHKSLLGRPAQYYSMVTVGASSVGFALKVRRQPLGALTQQGVQGAGVRGRGGCALEV
jgi:rhomboid domain-containing protein 1